MDPDDVQTPPSPFGGKYRMEHELRPVSGTATGIVASVGRTFHGAALFRAGIKAGALNFRLALGLHDRDHATDFRVLRGISGELGQDVDIILDLPSSRPRLGHMADRMFTAGQRALLVDEKQCAESGDLLPLPGLSVFCGQVEPGHRVVFRDQRQEFLVRSRQRTCIEIECMTCTEPIRTANACSFPDSGLHFDPIRGIDEELLRTLDGEGLCPDWIAPSLITEPGQVDEVRGVIEGIWPGKGVRIMAKIETAEALARLDAILEVSDGVLLGRGDLGLSVAAALLPRAQQRVAERATRVQKPLAVATQILERFAETGEPYRAELSDIALAVRQGAAGIVLCQETNNSRRPVDCIRMARAVIEAENA